MDAEQRNIGATVGMIKSMHKITGHDDTEVPIELSKLFIAESNRCSDRANNMCTFKDEPLECRIGNCPLGALVDKELGIIS